MVTYSVLLLFVRSSVRPGGINLSQDLVLFPEDFKKEFQFIVYGL